MSMNMKTQEKIKYFIYARKSSESEDRQIQSIDDQVSRLKQLADRIGLEIVEVLTESRSAKQPGTRLVFEDMLSRIEQGEANGILCWQFNRLSRNPVDSGKLQWLLQQEVIQEIQTYDRVYKPDDNALLFSVESGTANQFILDLRKNTKRGLQSKVEKGWRPGLPPAGYINDKEDKTIVPDPERYDMVRKMWDLMLTGAYTPPQVLKEANKWGFKTKKYKRIGGTQLSKSGIYRIFSNIFYAGKFEYNGKEHDGSHQPMITLDEFDKVQHLIGTKGSPRPQSRFFSYTGMIKCGECGCMITAQTKTKHIKSTGEIREYTYYHCTRQKKGYKCSQPSVNINHLEDQIEDELKSLTIIPEFKEWALDVLNSQNDKEIRERQKIHESQQKSVLQTQKQLDNLTQMRYRELIDDEQFMREKEKLQEEIKKQKDELDRTDTRAENWLELTEKVFDFATHASDAFKNGSLQTKKEILRTMGSELTLKDKNLSIKLERWFVPIKTHAPAIKHQFQTLEPGEMCLDKTKNRTLNSSCSLWLRGWDSNPRPIGYTVSLCFHKGWTISSSLRDVGRFPLK